MMWCGKLGETSAYSDLFEYKPLAQLFVCPMCVTKLRYLCWLQR